MRHDWGLTVEEVSHVSSKDGQDPIVAVLTDEIDEEQALIAHEVPFRDAQHLSARYKN
jgi:hypothetical protein